MIEIYNDGKWVTLKVLDKNPDLNGFKVMHDPADKAFHSMIAMNGELISFRFQGQNHVGVFRIDAQPIFEPDSIEFCHAAMEKEVR